MKEYIITAEGLTKGQESLTKMADQVAKKQYEMVKQTLKEDYGTILEVKVTNAVIQAISEATTECKEYSMKILEATREGCANRLIETQMSNRLNSIDDFTFDELDEFNSDVVERKNQLASTMGNLVDRRSNESDLGF